jgi:hypothetical protein
VFTRNYQVAAAWFSGAQAQLVISAALFVTALACLGCAVHKPVLARPVAQLVIPVACIDGVTAGTAEVRCDQLSDDPRKALCKGGLIVQFHCTKVAGR